MGVCEPKIFPVFDVVEAEDGDPKPKPLNGIDDVLSVVFPPKILSLAAMIKK